LEPWALERCVAEASAELLLVHLVEKLGTGPIEQVP
jgi:hypothetical protein